MQILLNHLSDAKQEEKREQRRKNLIIGFITSLSIYAFFVFQHFSPEDKLVSNLSVLIIGFLYVMNFFASIAILTTIGNSSRPQEHCTAADIQSQEKIIQVLVDSYYPDGTIGKTAEKVFLFAVTVPYYFVVTFVLQNIPLLIVLFWARFNMVAFENLQKHYFALIEKQKENET